MLIETSDKVRVEIFVKEKDFRPYVREFIFLLLLETT